MSRLRASYQQLDSESDKEKQPPFAVLGEHYPISCSYINLNRLEWAGINLGSRLGYEPEFHLSTERLLGQAPSGDEVSHRVADGRGTGGRGRPWALGQRR